MRRKARGLLVLDTGILLSFLQGELKSLLDDIMAGEKIPVISKISLIEIYYVLCRRRGFDEAKRILEKILASGYFKVEDLNDSVMSLAGDCKCKYSISLADCIVISTAKKLGTKALFRRESEIEFLAGKEPVELVS